MSTNKKYFYLKLKDSFFDNTKVVLLRNNNKRKGDSYVLLLLRLYLLSLKFDGLLLLDYNTPLTYQDIASASGYPETFVKNAMEEMERYSLIERLPKDVWIMSDIQNFIGNSSTEADRKRKASKKTQAIKARSVASVEELFQEVSEIGTKEIPPPETERESKTKKENNSKSDSESKPEKEVEITADNADPPRTDIPHRICPKCGGYLYKKFMNNAVAWCHLDGWQHDAKCKLIFNSEYEIDHFDEIVRS